MHLRAGALLGCMLLSGCYSVRQQAVLPVPVTLDAPSDFQILPPEGAPPPANACMVLRARLDVTHVSGDTLHFSGMQIIKQPPGAPHCEHNGPGRVVVVDNPEIVALELRRNRVLTVGAAVLVIPMVAASALLLYFFG